MKRLGWAVVISLWHFISGSSQLGSAQEYSLLLGGNVEADGVGDFSRIRKEEKMMVEYPPPHFSLY